MKPYCAALILAITSFFFNNLAVAQEISIVWMDATRVDYKHEDVMPVGNGHYLLLKKKEVKRITFKQTAENERTVYLADEKLTVLKEKTLLLQGSSQQINGFYKFGGNILLLYTVYNYLKETATVYAVKINPATLVSSEKQLAVLEIDQPETGSGAELYRMHPQELPWYKIRYSSDSSKMLLFSEGPQQKKHSKQLFLGVYDTVVNTVWKRTIDLPFTSWYGYCNDADLLNDDRVIVSLKHYEKQVGPQSESEEPDEVPPYTYKLMVFSKDPSQKQEITARLNDYFIESTTLSVPKAGKPTIGGLYKKKHDGNISGVFYANLDDGSFEIINTRTKEFPADFLSLIEKDKFGKSGGSDPGLYPFFKIQSVSQRTNGSVDLLVQYRKGILRTFDTEKRFYSAGDIIIVNLNNADLNFTRIPLNHSISGTAAGLGCFVIARDDKLIVLYNDHRDNAVSPITQSPRELKYAKSAAFVAAIVDAKGNVTRKLISEHKENYLSSPPHAYFVVNNKYIIPSILFSRTASSIGFGLLEIK